MAFEKAYIFGVQQQLNSNYRLPPTHITAEVVLLNVGTKDVRPMLFQLNKDNITDEDIQSGSRIMSIDDDAFMMVGEVLSINRKSKLIILSNDNTVSYKHLIIAKDEEFGTTLNALIEALRVQKNIPNNLFALKNMIQRDKSFKCTPSNFVPPEQQRNLEKIVHPTISDSLKSKFGNYAISGDKKLCELQIKT